MIKVVEGVFYPNGVEVDVNSVDMSKALDFMYGTDRDSDNSSYTEIERQRAIDYWMSKKDPIPPYMRESNSIKPVEHPGWDYWEMPENYQGPWTPCMYTKDVDDLLLTIYPPQRDYNSSIPSYTDDYHAQIEREDAHQGDLDCYVTGFETFEDAEEFINNKLAGYTVTEDVT